MKEHQTIFSIKELKNKVKNTFIDGIPNQDEKIKLIENWQENIISGKVVRAKEEELKPLFLTLLFGDVLGYEYKNSTDWNLRLENKSSLDSSKADAALGFFKIKEKQELDKDVRAVIEIKDARTTLDKPQNRSDFKGSAVEQCFMYAVKSGEKCKWVIVSNFVEIRLYLANDMTKYESFDILSLNDKYEFYRFYYLLANGQLFYPNIASSIDNFLANRQEREKTITKEFYEKYQYLREVFLQHLKLHNPEKNPLDLLQYAQTIIDRILFVSVIKDYDLIHYDVLKRIEKLAEESYAKDKEELWRQLKNLFVAIDEGLPPRIQKFNGGLFRQNEAVETLIIKNVFLKQLLTLSNYDFESDLNVNILGHIFEQSITDIENLKKEITENKPFEYTETENEITYKSHLLETNKRKKQGIYYTPEKITYYIVSNAIGSWLEEQKEKIGINQLTNFPDNLEERDKHLELWEQYKIVLKSVKILDPACGSGAFLTQAFDFLLQEWLIVLDVIQNLKNEKIQIREKGLFQFIPHENPKMISKIKKEIVNNNLFGVDLNHESVEITKLGLWLKSASKNDALALLDTNIKCGNSLISDKEVSEKAFDWRNGFSRLFNPDKYFVETEKDKKEEIVIRNQELKELKDFRKNKPFYVKLNDVDNWISGKKTLINDLEYELKLLYEWRKTNPQPVEGFDIIIGNPPYVRQENLKKEEKQYLATTFKQTGNISADLYIYFYEKAFQLLNPNGILGYITPNKWFKTKYGKELRAFLKQFEIKQIIDFFELRVFEDAATDTQIILIKNKINATNFNYYPITKLENFEELKIKPISINPNDFNGSEWIFAQPSEYKILKRMYKNSIPLGEYLGNSLYLGIKTAFNEAFIIDKETKDKIVSIDPQSAVLIKPYAVPTNINKFYIDEKDKYFFINTGYDIEISPNNYFGIYEHLKQYDNELEKRQDKGKTRYNLRACDYYEKFEQPKIIYIYTAVDHNFYYDTESFYVNNSCFIISNADKFLALWLNSSIFEFYKHLNFVAYGNPENKGRCKLDYNKMIEVPIPIISDKQKLEFDVLFDNISLLYIELNKQKNGFLEIVKTQLQVGKISRKIENWYDLKWEEFNEELDKLKVKLDLKKVKEWNEFFTEEQKNVNPLALQIKEITQMIDKKIYEIYEISTAEINEIKNGIKIYEF